LPNFTLPITAYGALLDIFIDVSLPRKEAIKSAGLEIPDPVLSRGLVDTGASHTCIDPEIIKRLGINPTGTTSVTTPSTGSTPHTCNQFDVGIIIPSEKLNYQIYSLPVMESELSNQGFHVLIGRDILRNCILHYNGEMAQYTLSF